MNKIKKGFESIKAPVGSKNIIIEKTLKCSSKKHYKQIFISSACALSLLIAVFVISEYYNNHKIKVLSTAYKVKYESDGSIDWVWPTATPYIITSSVGYRWGRFHTGIDISGSGFGSPIYSATDGVVIEVFSSCPDEGSYGSHCGKGDGNYIIVETSNRLTIKYSHIGNNILVSVGQKVKKEEQIGYMASSGSSSGYHLHFEVRDKDQNILNPCQIAFEC